MSDRTYILVHHGDGSATLHTHPSFEECNVDDSQVRTTLSESTAAEFIKNGQAKVCHYCEPFPDPQTLNTRGGQ